MAIFPIARCVHRSLCTKVRVEASQRASPGRAPPLRASRLSFAVGDLRSAFASSLVAAAAASSARRVFASIAPPRPIRLTAASVERASVGCIDDAVSAAAFNSGSTAPRPGAPSPQSAYALTTDATSRAYIRGASLAMALSSADRAVAVSLPHTRADANELTASAISSASMFAASRTTPSTHADTTDHGGASPASAYPSSVPAMFLGVNRGASRAAARANASLTPFDGATPARRNARSASPMASGPKAPDDDVDDDVEDDVAPLDSLDSSRSTARPRASPANGGIGAHPASAKASSVLTTSPARIAGAALTTALASASRVVAAGLTRLEVNTASASTASDGSENLAIFWSSPDASGAAPARW
mmetsp:Transcript_3915/g.15939  ORF Transcript_3915/g.15939 Transcript_3915/m.15939 type:complete len:362 (-) Transcript_3915:2166-3251(-)